MSNTYDTSDLPLGTTSPKALYNNASNMDDAMNSELPSWTDRFGRLRETFSGMEQAFSDFLLVAGYVDIGDYDLDGPLTITQRNQIFSHSGSYYRAGPSLVLPYTTLNNWGVDSSNFVLTGDATLRAELGSASGSTLVFDGAASVADKLTQLRAPQFASLTTTGTVNAIIASFDVPPLTFENGRVVYVRALGANTVASPTFTPNTGVLPAKAIYKGAGAPLVAGDVSGVGFTLELRYDSTFDAWALLNPANPVSQNADITTINGGTVRGPGNPIVNGAFDVWQLGTVFSFGPHLQKTADRWNYDFNGAVGSGDMSRQLVPSGSKFAGFAPTYCMSITQTVAGSGNTFQDVSTQIEGVDTYQGQLVTISFYATYGGAIIPTFTAIKTEQYFGSGGSPSGSQFTTSAPVTLQSGAGIWRRYSVQAQLASTAGKTLGTNQDDTLNVIFTMPLNQLYSIDITCVQIEPGAHATPYQYKPRAQTMEECQRYLQTSYDEGVAPGTATSVGVVGFSLSGANSVFTLPQKAVMRSFPALTLYNAAGGAGSWNTSGGTLPVALNTGGTKGVTIATTGGVAGNFCTGHYVLQDPLI